MGCPEPPQSSTSSLTFSSTETNCTVCFVVSGASCPGRGSAEIVARAISEIVELARCNRSLHLLAFICVGILQFAVIYYLHATCQDRAHNPLLLTNRLDGNRVRIWETSVQDRTQGLSDGWSRTKPVHRCRGISSESSPTRWRQRPTHCWDRTLLAVLPDGSGAGLYRDHRHASPRGILTRAKQAAEKTH
jgi:hypothetical protein